MENYLKEFNSHSDYETFKAGTDFIRPNVSICNLEDDVHYNGHDYSKDYFTFRILEDGTVTFRAVPDDSGINYSKDNGQTWSSIGYTSPLTVSKGDKVLFKATNPTFSSSGMGHFGSTCRFTVEGNIMSLHFGDNFENLTDLTGKDYAFKFLFVECTNLISALKLILPATTLSSECYSNMFNGCTSLTTAPALPATTLTTSCYSQMFSDCTSLTTAPELPATTLKASCYESMFQGCTSLTTAPELPATTLVSNCYQYMFYGCSKLNYIKALFTTTPSASYTNNWVYGVAATGTFVKNSIATWTTTGANGVPTGWTVQTASA